MFGFLGDLDFRTAPRLGRRVRSAGAANSLLRSAAADVPVDVPATGSRASGVRRRLPRQPGLMPASGPSRRPLFLLAVAAVAAFAAFELGAWWVDRVWFFQWATAREGRPALSGVWVGQLATGTGRPRGVLVEMGRHIPKRRPTRCDRCGSIRGRALTCDERGAELAYRLIGTPSDRRATRVELSVAPTVDPPPDGLEMSTLIGG